MVDIEVGKARVYFSVGNRAKMGARELEVVKYNFSKFKRPRFGHQRLFFLFQRTNQTSVVLVSPILKEKLGLRLLQPLTPPTEEKKKKGRRRRRRGLSQF